MVYTASEIGAKVGLHFFCHTVDWCGTCNYTLGQLRPLVSCQAVNNQLRWNRVHAETLACEDAALLCVLSLSNSTTWSRSSEQDWKQPVTWQPLPAQASARWREFTAFINGHSKTYGVWQTQSDAIWMKKRNKEFAVDAAGGLCPALTVLLKSHSM